LPRALVTGKCIDVILLLKPNFDAASIGLLRLLVCAPLLCGCRREAIQVYEVPKEKASPAAASVPSSAPRKENVRWTRPASWQEQPASGMRVGSFSISRGGKTAEVSIIPLAGAAGNELDNVNRWRGQVSLPPISKPDLAAATQPASIAGGQGHLFDMSGRSAQGSPTRIVAALLDRGGTGWFFKLTGEEGLVGEEKAVFIEFLKTVRFDANAPEQTGPVPPAPAQGDGGPALSKWAAPSHWREEAPSSMVLVNYRIADPQGGSAKVTVSSFPGDVGGALANVNRWRGQLGLEPLPGPADLEKALTPIDVEGGKAMLADMSGTDARTGNKARMIAAILPKEGNTWFFKLMGDEAAVMKEKEAFAQFVRNPANSHAH
jgi:hypothetical protein